MIKKRMKKTLVAAGIVSSLMTSTAFAANWLALQGTEPDDAAPRAKLWGFIQTQYQTDNSEPNSSNEYVPPKLINANLTSQDQFNVNRARIGVRGTGFPLDGKVNYFFLAEFGSNAITLANGGNPRITDASITLNQIPGARIRMGLFKTPGNEEGLQAIHVFDYINFSTVANQLMLERFPTDSYVANNGPVTLPATTSAVGFDKPVGAFRDVGIQVFDIFKKDDWEHSYAVMLGNGNGLNFGDNDDSKDLYLYWSSEKVFGGKKGRREGLKMFVWSQTGKRTLQNADTVEETQFIQPVDSDGNLVVDSDGNPVYVSVPGTETVTKNAPTQYDRKRSGLGFKYLKKPYRVTFEYMQGDGMIFVGPDKPTFIVNTNNSTTTAAGDGRTGKANGWYLDGGWYIPGSKWEIDARYDVYNRLTDATPFPGGANAGRTFEMQFKTITLGAQYHINKKTRINMEVAKRDFSAVDFPEGAGPNDNLDGVDTRYAIQLTHIF